MTLQSEAQERGRAGDADLMSSDGMKTEKADETDHGKHGECEEKGRPRAGTEPWKMLTLGGLTWEGSEGNNGKERNEDVLDVGRRLKEYGQIGVRKKRKERKKEG